MKQYFILLTFYSSFFSFANEEQTKSDQNLRNEIELLKSKVALLEKNSFNSTIERDLLRETYQRNYERINLTITAVLGVFGVLGFLGIKDINSIKKEYRVELDELRRIKAEFESKSKEFDFSKSKIDSEIKEILEENEKQNKKFRLIESKEKIRTFLDQEKNYDALEYLNAAIETNPNDSELLNNQAKIFVRLNNPEEALKSQKKCVDINPKDYLMIEDYLEYLAFNGKFSEADIILNSNPQLFGIHRDEALGFFNLIRKYHEGDLAAFKEELRKALDFEQLNRKHKKMRNKWDFTEAKYFASHQQEGDLKKVLQNTIWFFDGQVSTNEVCQVLSIPKPRK